MLLITGATGHIGRALVHEFDAQGVQQRVLIRDPCEGHRRIDCPAPLGNPAVAGRGLRYYI